MIRAKAHTLLLLCVACAYSYVVAPAGNVCHLPVAILLLADVSSCVRQASLWLLGHMPLQHIA